MIIIASYSNVSVTYTADGTQTVFSFPFDYLRKAFVFVEADGTALEQGTDFSVYEKTVVFTTAPTAGTKLRIYRETETIPLVSWADASVLKAKDMTIQQVQVLHILEEYKGQYDEDLANMLVIAGIVTDSEELQNIVDQFNAIENNVATVETATATATEAAETATTSETTINGLVASLTNLYNDAIAQGTLTAPAIDDTLNIVGAAADAAAVGNSVMLAKGTITSGTNLNNVKAAGMYLVSNGTIAQSLSNYPTTAHGQVNVYNYKGSNTSGTTGILQTVYSAGAFYWRRWSGSVWSAWKKILDESMGLFAEGAIDYNTDIDTITTAGMYHATTDGLAATLVNYPTTAHGNLNVFHYKGNDDSVTYGHGVVQVVFSNGYIYWREKFSSTWSDWIQVANYTDDLQKVMNGMPISRRLTEKWDYGLYRSDTKEETQQWVTTDKIFCMPYDITLTIPSTAALIIAIYDDEEAFSSYYNCYLTTTISANTHFRVSIRTIPQATISDIDTVVDMLQITTWDMATTYDLISETKNTITAALEGGSFHPRLESGTKTAAGVLQTSSTRLRTVNGIPFPVQAGDTISLSDYNTYKMYIRGNSVYQDAIIVSDVWYTSDYTVPLEGKYYILVERIDGANMTREDIETLVVTVTTVGLGAKQASGTSTNLGFATLSMFPTIGVCGDSWASGSLHHPDGSGWTGNYDISWCQDLGRMTGTEVTNFTHGGRSVKTWITDTEYGLSALLASTPKNLYILCFGINDNTQINNGTLTVGTIDDCYDDYTQNPDTFYGCYGRIIGNIKAYAPNAVIVISSVGRPNERANMDPRIQEVAERFDLPYIYLPDDPFFTSDFFVNSIYEGHPVSYGYGGMAKAIERLICANIEQHPEYYELYYGTTETGIADE